MIGNCYNQKYASTIQLNSQFSSIAEDLKAGRLVLPQLYANATVLFSDIRGFTRIASTSTPMQVVQFLNDLFSGFDAIISKHDAYKVETVCVTFAIIYISQNFLFFMFNLVSLCYLLALAPSRLNFSFDGNFEIHALPDFLFYITSQSHYRYLINV